MHFDRFGTEYYLVPLFVSKTVDAMKSPLHSVGPTL